jgi:pyrroloquinoline quinone biosynthesis protein D
MNDNPARLRRVTVADESIIAIPRHCRLRYDKTRSIWTLQVPERVLALDEVAVEILQLCDGQRTVATVVDELAAKYNLAERDAIRSDVVAMLQDLADKHYVADLREVH